MTIKTEKKDVLMSGNKDEQKPPITVSLAKPKEQVQTTDTANHEEPVYEKVDLNNWKPPAKTKAIDINGYAYRVKQWSRGSIHLQFVAQLKEKP